MRRMRDPDFVVDGQQIWRRTGDSPGSRMIYWYSVTGSRGGWFDIRYLPNFTEHPAPGPARQTHHAEIIAEFVRSGGDPLRTFEARLKEGAKGA